jgi:phosphosulfolactate synthase
VNNPYWSELLVEALPGRVEKPRISGLTMVIDTGTPLTMMRDILQMAAAHIDFWKFGFASASVCPAECVMSKVSLCQEYGVYAYPGGTSLEIAVSQRVWKDYLCALWEGGVRVVEVSDGTIDLPLRQRREIIRTASKMGFSVLSEVGKKVSGVFLPVSKQAQLIQGDLNSGANYVIVEGRESGKGIGVYDQEGNIREEDVNALLDALGPLSTRLIWEAPLKTQQIYYINKFGNKVNLGNIVPLEVTGLESLRRGFRSDTLRVALGIPEQDFHSDPETVGLPSESVANGHGVERPTSPPKLWTDSGSVQARFNHKFPKRSE